MYLKSFKRTIAFLILSIIIEIFFSQQIYAAPFRYYPDTYEVKISNIKEKDIENIEVEYNVKAFSCFIDDISNYNDYNDYNDKKVQEKLTQKAIENIGLNINSDEWKKAENGEWIFDDTNHITRMVKCNISKPQYLNNAVSLIIYNINDFYGREVSLKISMKNGDIIYSNSFNYLGKLVDEYSNQKEYDDAKKITKKIGYFEGNYNKETNEVNVSFIGLNDELINKTSNLRMNIIKIIVPIILILIILLIIFIKKHIRKIDNNK